MKPLKIRTDTFTSMRDAAKRHYDDSGFCGVVATAAVARVSFGKAKAWLEDGSRANQWTTIKGRAFWKGREQVAALPNTPRKHRGGTHVGRQLAVIESLRPGTTFDLDGDPQRYGTTLGQAIRNVPKTGTFIIWTTAHVTCVRDGEVIDWANESRRHRVLQVIECEVKLQ
jgi:hypothetical protein